MSILKITRKRTRDTGQLERSIRELAAASNRVAIEASGGLVYLVPRNFDLGKMLSTGAGANKTIEGDGSDNIAIVDSPATLGGKPIIYYNEADGNSSRTAISFANKVSLNIDATAELVTNSFLVFFSAEVRSEDSGTRCSVRLQHDDSDAADTIAEEDPNPDVDAGIGYGTFAGVVLVNFTAGVIHTLDIDFASTQAGKAVHIRRARLSAVKTTNLAA